MKYLIAIIFVSFSISLSFAQTGKISTKTNQSQMVEKQWDNIRNELQISRKKIDQIRNVEENFDEDMKSATGNRLNYLQSRKEQDLYKLLSKEQSKKYEVLMQRVKQDFREN